MRARSAWTRTAGFRLPWMVTRPTPVIWLSRCASSVSAISLIARIEVVSDVSASVITGASAGFTFA